MTIHRKLSLARVAAWISPICLVLLCLTAAACEPAPGDITTDNSLNVPTLLPGASITCDDVAPPSCVTSCGTGISVQPTCENDTWRCTDSMDVSYCPDFADDCDEEAPCGAGYTCVDSVTYPVPVDHGSGICRKGAITRRPEVEACRPDGTLTTAEFLSGHSQNTGQIIKVAGEISVQMSCSHFACAEHDPCCNTCLGNYVMQLRDPDDGKKWVDLLVDVGAPGCSGTTCDTSCGSLQPGDTYTVWGVLDGCQGLHRCTMLVMGSCPL